MTNRTNTTGSSYFPGMNDGDIAEGINGLTPEKRDYMVRHHFPGKALPEGTNVADALVAADADFEVVKIPLEPTLGAGLNLKRMETKVGLYRKDTLQELGSAGPNYGIIQNDAAFAAADVLVSNGEMALDKIQVIDNGSRVRLQGLVGTSHIEQLGVGCDVLAHYALFEANHDGIRSTTGALYTVRLRCFNGMTAKTKNNQFSVRHTSKATDRIAEAQAALINIHESAIAEAEVFQELAQRKMSLESFVTFADELLATVRKPITDESTEKQKRKRTTDVMQLANLFENGVGNVGLSAYDGYNSVTEWVTARRSNFKDAAAFAKKFESQVGGYNARTKATALRILTR